MVNKKPSRSTFKKLYVLIGRIASKYFKYLSKCTREPAMNSDFNYVSKNLTKILNCFDIFCTYTNRRHFYFLTFIYKFYKTHTPTTNLHVLENKFFERKPKLVPINQNIDKYCTPHTNKLV